MPTSQTISQQLNYLNFVHDKVAFLLEVLSAIESNFHSNSMTQRNVHSKVTLEMMQLISLVRFKMVSNTLTAQCQMWHANLS